ncbi:hypothetical protein SNEBB_008097 [Seison nebaliae]|nr:hypothetical protein SNEBB_008097 [Seison nebaliae]
MKEKRKTINRPSREEIPLENGPLYKRNGQPVYGLLPPISKSSTATKPIIKISNESLRRIRQIPSDNRPNQSISIPNEGLSSIIGPTVANSYKKYQGILQYGIGKIVLTALTFNMFLQHMSTKSQNVEFIHFLHIELFQFQYLRCLIDDQFI